MDKTVIAQYLVNLQTIMEGKEDAGRPRGNTLIDEYNRNYEQLTGTIRQEQEHDTRHKAGTGRSSGEPERG